MKLFNGDCLEVLRTLEENSLDALVTDPPAGIAFMNKEWDRAQCRNSWIETMRAIYSECLRILKPGAHGLVWALPRTSHWTATALENAGFEVRDVVTHLFGTGFPKSLDISKAIDKAAGAEREVVGSRKKSTATHFYDNGAVMGRANFGAAQGSQKTAYETIDLDVTAPSTDAAKQWQGWGTALKPASEHWILVRKPISEKTVAANVLKWGVGGLNIDASRVEAVDAESLAKNWDRMQSDKQSKIATALSPKEQIHLGEYNKASQGRFPANLVLDGEAAAALDAQSGIGKAVKTSKSDGRVENDNQVYGKGLGRHSPENSYADTGGASRFFYVAKASASEKNAGLDRTEIVHVSVGEWEHADQKATLQVDTALSPPRVIDASGTLLKSVPEWNTLLFGNGISEPQQKECKFTIKTGTSSITESKTLNWFLRSNTSASTPDVSLSTACGGSRAEPAQNLSPSSSTTNDATVIATSASDAQSVEALQIKSAGALKTTHPTVKPLKLMEYLIRLITPPNGIVLDPFMGSGSTGLACKNLSFEFIGIEREAEYFAIAEKRISLS